MFTGSHVLLFTAGLLALQGCASAAAEKPAVCDGKHRRAANVYGSVLPTIPLPGQPVPVPAAAAPALGTGLKPAPVKPAASPGPLSRLDIRSFDPCGRPA